MAIDEAYDGRQGGQYQQVHLLAKALKARMMDRKK